MNARFVGSLVKVASIAAVPLAALSIAAPAGAQGYGQRELFDWRGNVDQEVRVEMQGARTSVIPMGPREMTGYDNARAIAGVPSTDGYVTVQMREGRGIADVVEQPSAQNGYTTVVRIRDTQGGAGAYDVAAFWQPGDYGYGNSVDYGTYGGQYDPYDQYGNYGAYNNGYGAYPQTVIVEPRPVYRPPVYTDRDRDRDVIGKTLPAPPQRVNTYPARPQYPDHAVDRGGYQNGSAQHGKDLPRTAQPRPSVMAQPAPSVQPARSSQPGKTLPSASSSGQHQDWHRGH